MKIDFNHIRLEALRDYGDLVRQLRSHMDDTGRIVIEQEEIEGPMNSIRGDLIAIAASFLPGDEDCKCVLDENTKVPWLNPDEDEDSDD